MRTGKSYIRNVTACRFFCPRTAAQAVCRICPARGSPGAHMSGTYALLVFICTPQTGVPLVSIGYSNLRPAPLYSHVITNYQPRVQIVLPLCYGNSPMVRHDSELDAYFIRRCPRDPKMFIILKAPTSPVYSSVRHLPPKAIIIKHVSYH
jgi:hypothetical protein